MLTGVLKYQRIMTSPEHRAPVYVDIAHRAALLYSFAMLVIAKLLEYNPYSMRVQTAAVAAVLLFLVLSILGYLSHGIRNDTENIFHKRSFTTTWYMYLLIVGEIGGLSVILWGFIETQII
jgi:hypothetical protein